VINVVININCREGAVTYSGLREDVEKAKSCEDLLDIAKVSISINH